MKVGCIGLGDIAEKAYLARQRGIEQAVLFFLDAVRAGRVLSARDALETHELCERVVRTVLERSHAA